MQTYFCKVENLLVAPSLLPRCPPPTWLPPVVVTVLIALFTMSLIGRGRGAPGLLRMREMVWNAFNEFSLSPTILLACMNIGYSNWMPGICLRSHVWLSN